MSSSGPVSGSVAVSVSASGSGTSIASSSGGGTGGGPTTASASSGTGGAGGSGCEPGYADCNGDDGDGCEAELAVSPIDCGRCGRGCRGDACVDGACAVTTLAVDEAPTQIGVDEGAVYWTSYSLETLSKVATTGGDVEVLSSGIKEPTGLAVDESHVYLTAYTAGGGAGLRRIPKRGGDPEALDPCNTAVNLALDATHVFYVTAVCGASFRMRRRSKAAPDDMIELADPHAADGYAYATYGYTAMGTDDVFWASAFAINQAPTSLAAGTEIATDLPQVHNIAHGGGRLLVAAGPDLLAMNDDGSAVELLASAQFADTFQGLTVDETHVFWGSDVDGAIRSMPLAGGEPVTLATGQEAPRDIAVDATHVYWVDPAAGAIRRVAR